MESIKPKTFFKYYSPEAAKATLANGTLRWSSPRMFNDPFDSQINLLVDQDEDILTEKIFEAFINLISSEGIIDTYISAKMNMALNTLRILYKNSGSTFSEEHLTSLKAAAREGAKNALASFPRVNAEIKNLNRDISMFCISEVKDSIPMWSYYAKDHTGIVLEFLPYIYNSPISVAKPVNYVPSIPRLSAQELLDTRELGKRTLDIISLTKFDEWSHEKEWRVVTTLRDKTKDFEYLPFNKQELGSIIFGTKISKTDYDEILALVQLNFPHAKLHQAELDKNEFKLNFQKIEKH